MRLIIDHQTRYHYADVVRRSTQYLRLTPHSTARQQILSWQLELPGEATCTTDGYGNILHVLSLESPHEGILIRALGEVEGHAPLQRQRKGRPHARPSCLPPWCRRQLV